MQMGAGRVLSEKAQDWILVREAAARLGITTNAVNAALKREKIKGREIKSDGGIRSQWLVYAPSLDNYNPTKRGRAGGRRKREGANPTKPAMPSGAATETEPTE